MRRYRGLEYWEPDEFPWQPGLPDDLWFTLYQRDLLALANTREGRDLLGLNDSNPYKSLGDTPITHITKEFVTFGDPRGEQLTVCQSGAPRGNVIRKRWAYVHPALERMWVDHLPHVNGRLVPAGGATTVTAKPDAHAESATVDGYVSHADEGNTFAAIRDAAGNGAADSGNELLVYILADDISNRFHIFYRAITLFDVSSIADTQRVSGVKITAQTSVLSDQFSQSLGWVASAPASNTALVNGDYDSLGTTNYVTQRAVSARTNGQDVTFTGTADGIASISLDGITKWGSKASSDISGSAPTWGDGYKLDARWKSREVSDSLAPRLAVTHSSVLPVDVIFF